MDEHHQLSPDASTRPAPRRPRPTLGAALLTGALVLAGCGGGGGSGGGGAGGGSTELTIAFPTATLAPKEEVATYAVATELGYFEEEGLTVDFINADGSTAAVQAVASGSADLAPADAGSIIGGAAKGVPVQAVGGLVQHWPWKIGVAPDSPIQRGTDLKGRKVGVISLASGSAPFARAFIEDAGLTPDQDVSLIPVGVGAQARGALDSGEVDALALYDQAYQVIENDGVEFRYLENPAVFDGIRSLTWATTDQAVEGNAENLGKFLRAAYKGLLYTAANPEAAMRMGYEHLPQLLGGRPVEERLDDDVRSLQAWLDTAVPASGDPATWSDWGAIDDASWQATMEFAQFAGQIDEPVELDEVWSPDLLDTANDFDAQEVLEAAKSPPTTSN